MTGRFFVDANILIYAHDLAEPVKQGAAAALLDRLAARDAGLLSTQVLAEFFSVVTRKLPRSLTLEEAGGVVGRYIQSWCVAEVTPLVVLEAVGGAIEHRLSYWDAQIWATAKLNQAPVVLSEDFQDGRVIEGIEFRDPFAPTFDLEVFAPSL
jgi:predicted nucleic acid-binding protein